jgi:hypothetical protein
MPQSIADLLKDAAFGVASLTESIKLLPNTYSKVGQSGIFVRKGVNSRTIALEYAGGRFTCCPIRMWVVRASAPSVTRRTCVLRGAAHPAR